MTVPPILLTLFRAPQYQPLRYLAVGGWNTLFGAVVYAALHYFLNTRVHYLVLFIPANILAITNAFLCYKYIVFQTSGSGWKEYFKCYFVYGWIALLNVGLLILLVRFAHLHPSIANCFCIITATLISYFSHKHFSFRKTDHLQVQPVIKRYLSLFYWGTVLLFSGVYCMLAYKIPLPWVDEVSIVQAGCAFVERFLVSAAQHADTSVVPVVPFYYIGPAIADLSYRVTGFPGSRIVAVMALLLSVLLCRRWLRKRGFSGPIASVFSLVLLIYPIVSQSVKTRIDVLTLVPCFIILNMLITAQFLPEHQLARRFFVLGVLAAFSLFVWPTAFLFGFFYLYEFHRLTKQSDHIKRNVPQLSGAVIFGGIAGCLLCILPISGNIYESLQALHLYAVECQMAPSLKEKCSSLLFTTAYSFLRECLRDPFFMILLVVGFFANTKNRLFISYWLVALSVCILSGFYIFRIFYLIPFLLLVAIHGFLIMRERKKGMAYVFLGLMIAYQMFISIIYPATVALILRGRSHGQLARKLVDVIGQDGQRVYSYTFQTYYAGRDLHWKYYMPGTVIANAEAHACLLKSMDFIIVPQGSIPFSADEEGFTLYHFLRDYVIYRAKQEMTADNKSCFAMIGTSLAGKSPTRDDHVKFETTLISMGFEKFHFIDMTTPISAYTPYQQWIVQRLGVPPDYDNFIIWKRKQKAETSLSNNILAK